LDPHAGATFRENFPEAVFYEGPVSALRPRKLLRDAKLRQGELDCLIGGPPCQSFSYNNHQRSATDQRARLFRKYLQIVRALYPKTLVMENVPGMLTIGSGRIVDEIRSELKALGYECEIRILYSEDFGVPQARRRAFVIASRLGNPAGVFPAGTHGPSVKPSAETNVFIHRWAPAARKRQRPFVTVWDAIADLPCLRNGVSGTASKYRRPAATKTQRELRGRIRTVRNHTCHALTPAMLKRIAHVSEGGNWTQIPRKLLPAGMRRARLSDHTKRYGRLKRTGLASTILTKCDPHWGAYVHPTQDRTVSVREAARLQGFPDRFHFAGDHISKHYEQVGNAVPVPVACAIGRAVSSHVSTLVRSARRSGRPIRKRPPAAHTSSLAKSVGKSKHGLASMRYRRRRTVSAVRYRTYRRHAAVSTRRQRLARLRA
jgi:DNA (cytosine-5)-methyltransferase 1